MAAIAESKGADGIVGFADKFPTGNIRDLNNPDLKIVYTADSPSAFLLDLTIVGFDLFHLTSTNTWRVAVGGAREALERARRHEGDMFVLWEPELSRALHEVPELKYFSSDKFSGYIKDVFVFHRDFVQRHDEARVDFFDVYFTVMRSYANDRTRLLTDMAQSVHLQREVVENMLQKIDWYDLFENAEQQFGRPATGALGDFCQLETHLTQLPGAHVQNRRRIRVLGFHEIDRIVNSSLLEKLVKRVPAMVGRQGGSPVHFTSLSATAGKACERLVHCALNSITFQAGGERLDDTGKEQVDKIATLLVNNYPGYRVAVRVILALAMRGK
jgi:hypothetical protein